MHQSPRADSVEDPAASARSLTSRATRWRGHGFPWLHGNVAEGVNETTSAKEKPPQPPITTLAFRGPRHGGGVLRGAAAWTEGRG